MKKHSKNIKLVYIVFLLILLYLITGLTSERYYKSYPTLKLYPNNLRELEKVKQYIYERNSEMYEFIKLTDRSCSYAFLKYVDEDIVTLDKISQSINPLIHLFKYIFNRERPFNIDPTIDNYKSITANGPAFPSGHSAQAYYLAKILSKKYPEKKELLYKTAEKCGKARIYAGLHYPSDYEFGKFIVNSLP